VFAGSSGDENVKTRRDDRILIVDDNAAAVSGLVELLGDAGYQVVTASTFEEGKRLADEENPDLLIVDIRLGPYNGLQLAIRQRLKHPGRPIIITTAFPDAVLEREARHYGEFVAKPIDPADLVQLVRHLLDASGQDIAISS
jgi:DNA-binding response OmpR family regulator